MSSHSRRRARSKGDIAPPTERVSVDQVTGAVVVVALDAVRRAFESVRRAYDAVALRLSVPELERLADMLAVFAIGSKRHRERDLDALRALLAEMGGQSGETMP